MAWPSFTTIAHFFTIGDYNSITSGAFDTGRWTFRTVEAEKATTSGQCHYMRSLIIETSGIRMCWYLVKLLERKELPRLAGTGWT